MTTGTEPLSPNRLPASRVALAFSALLLALGLFLTVGTGAQLLSLPFGLWFTQSFVFFGATWLLVSRSGLSPASYAGLRGPWTRGLALGFVLGLLNFVALVLPLQLAVQSVTPEWMRELFDNSYLFESQQPWELAAIVAAVGVAAPVCEEFLFRGVFQRGLMSWLRPSAAVVVTGLVFSAFHFDPVGFLARFELGVLFGLLAWVSGSIWPSIAAHAANNLLSTALFFAFRGQTEGPTPVLPLLAVSGTALLALLGVLRFTRRDRRWWAAPQPAADDPVQPGRFWLKLGLLGGGAGLAIATLWFTDPLGVRLNWVDLQHRLPRVPAGLSAHQQEERDALNALRQKVRAGQAPLDDYVRKRRHLAAQR